MSRRTGPWTVVFLIGFVLYAAVGWLHGGGGARSTVFYGVAVVLLVLALLGIARGVATKPRRR